MSVDEVVDNITSAKEKIRFHDAFYEEYEGSESKLVELKEIHSELAALNASEAPEFGQRVEVRRHSRNIIHLFSEFELLA